MEARTRTTAVLISIIAALNGGCAITSPITPAEQSESEFDRALTEGTETIIREPKGNEKVYRLFEQGATGYVPISTVREEAEERADVFCRSRNKRRETIREKVANPPYILNNFPRIEIYFVCSGVLTHSDAAPTKYDRLREAKKLLDEGIITQQEYESEKQKILASEE